MQIKNYTNRLINTIRGDLPKSVFIWYIILISVFISTLLLIMYWYHLLYKITYDAKNGLGTGDIYKQIIDKQKLEFVLERYKLK